MVNHQTTIFYTPLSTVILNTKEMLMFCISNYVSCQSKDDNFKK